ncbi:MAG: hypothetical protein H7Z14_06700 [Anaerolineae bacterium]|nr:hypothetical protein [Phycisphaerae bacterium]
MKMLGRSIVLLLCATGAVLVAQTTAPTTTPATNAAISRTTPRSAAKALRVAMEAADETALRDLLFAADEDQRKLNDALGGVVVASSRLSAAANARFGDSGDPIAGKAFLPADLTGVDSASLEERGDIATIKLPARDHTLTLRRGQDGMWRIDLFSFAGATRQQLPQQLAMLHEFSAALNELATDTRGGRFVSVADLKAAIQDRVHGTIARSMREPRPATIPSTRPTSAPSDNR